MSSYSKDLRLKVLAATDRGTPRREVVGTFAISVASLKRRLKKRSEGEDLSPKHPTGRKRCILSSLEERRALWAQLEEHDDATLERHCELWEVKRGVKVSAATMSRAIRHRLGWTFKERLWEPRRGRPRLFRALRLPHATESLITKNRFCWKLLWRYVATLELSPLSIPLYGKLRCVLFVIPEPRCNGGGSPLTITAEAWCPVSPVAGCPTS